MTTALDAFGGSDLRTRVHTRIRWHSAPLESLCRLVRDTGDVLELGCGHGLLSLQLALECADRRVHGVDIDAAKIRAARAAAARLDLDDRVTFEQVAACWRPAPASADAVVVADVLYLLEAGRVREFVEGAISALRPGGTVVIKEMADRPRWKRRLAEVQERLSVHVLRITEGTTVRIPTEAELSDPIRAAGMEVERHDLSRHRLHPHVALIGRSTPTSAA